MDQFSEPDDDLDSAQDVLFEGRTDDGRRLTSMLASICLSSKRDASSTLAWCEVSDSCITFTVGVAKSRPRRRNALVNGIGRKF